MHHLRYISGNENYFLMAMKIISFPGVWTSYMITKSSAKDSENKFSTRLPNNKNTKQ